MVYVMVAELVLIIVLGGLLSLAIRQGERHRRVASTQFRHAAQLMVAVMAYHDLYTPLIRMAEVAQERGLQDDELGRLIMEILQRHKAAGFIALAEVK